MHLYCWFFNLRVQQFNGCPPATCEVSHKHMFNRFTPPCTRWFAIYFNSWLRVITTEGKSSDNFLKQDKIFEKFMTHHVSKFFSTYFRHSLIYSTQKKKISWGKKFLLSSRKFLVPPRNFFHCKFKTKIFFGWEKNSCA